MREKALEKFGPEQAELEESLKLYEEISDFIMQNYDVETHFAGSAGRGTCLAGDKDVDIFVMFPKDTDREELERRGLEIGEEVFEELGEEYNVEYAEHPYTKGEIRGQEVEIVPCYDVEPGEIRSAVDRTPHHTRWVKKNLDEELREDVVILKAFLDTQGVYGSSLRTRGFSGYLSEILVQQHGGFIDLLQAASEWDRRTVIDPEKHHPDGLPDRLEEKFSDDSLVVIDPVDPERNVASVLSDENYTRFVHRCMEFVDSPGIHFFEEDEKIPTEFEAKQEVSRRADILVISFGTPDQVEDVVYPQMRKFTSRLRQVLEEKDFRVYSTGFHVGENHTRVLLELDSVLPRIRKVQGPEIFHGKEHVEEFKSRYENTFIEGLRLYAKEEREFSEARELLNNFLTGDLKSKGVPKDVAESMRSWTFVEPVQPDDAWLKFLAEHFHIEGER